MTRRTFARIVLVLILFAIIVIIGIVAPVVYLGAAVVIGGAFIFDVLIRWATEQ